MNIEHPAAFSFLLQDEIYLLNKDKIEYNKPKAVQPVKVEPATETHPVNFNYLGGNKKNFLVVTNYPGQEFIAEAHFTALENILKRLGFGLEDIAIFNKAKYDEVTFDGMRDFFKPAKLLFLGKNALPLHIETLAHNELKSIGGCSVLYSFSFDDMMDNQEHKKAFWEQIKKL